MTSGGPARGTGQPPEGGAALRALVPERSGDAGPLVANLRGHDDAVTAVSISGDGRTVASGSVPRTVKVWDVETGAELVTLRAYGRHGPGEGYGEAVTAVAIAPDGGRVAAVDRDGLVQVWRLPGGDVLAVLGGEAGDDEDWAAAISAGCRWAVTTFESSIVPVVAEQAKGTTRVVDLVDGAVVAEQVDASGAASPLAISDVGPVVVRPGPHGLRVWAARGAFTTEEIGPFPGSSLAVSRDGATVVAGQSDGTVTVWQRAANGGAAGVGLLVGHTASVEAVAITPDGKLAASGSADATVRLWDVASLREVARFSGHVGAVLAVALSADGRRAVSGGADRRVRVWDVGSGTTTPHRLPVGEVRLDAAGTRLLAISTDGSAEAWDLPPATARPSGSPPPEPPHEPPPVPAALHAQVLELEQGAGAPDRTSREVVAVATTPDRRRVACITRERTVLSGHHRWGLDESAVHVWDLDEPTRLRVLSTRSTRTVGWQEGEPYRAVAISAGGTHVVAVADDGSVCLWEIGSGALVGRFDADGPLDSCAISADGRTVAAGSATGAVHALRLEEER